MFKKRAIQVKWVEVPTDNKSDATDAPVNAPETQVIEVVKESTKYALIMFAGYKAFDTISKCAMIAMDNKTK